MERIMTPLPSGVTAEAIETVRARLRDDYGVGIGSVAAAEFCQAILAALRPTQGVDREAVARIIDPIAFKSWQGLYAFCLPQDGEEDARRYADQTHKAQCDKALAKADAIIALSLGGGDE
jgi:hypothetical protein